MTIALPGPARLLTALSTAIDQHPYAVRGDIVSSARTDSDGAALWRRLGTLRGADLAEAVDALAELEVRLLVATVRTRLTDALVLGALAVLIERRRPDGWAALAWETYLVTDGHAEFRHPAAEYVRTEAGTRPAWLHLVRGARPSDVALALYRAQAAGLEPWAAAPAVALDRWSPLVRRVQTALLAAGGLAQLARRETPATIERWVQTVVPADAREDWYRAYLEETRNERRPATHAVLQAILERFGAPSVDRPFWATVSDEARRAFELWLIDARLTELLGEGERVDFWRRFLPHVKRAWRNSDGEVVFLDIGGACAVQFVESGTATYLFPQDAFRRIARGRASDVRISVYRNSARATGWYDHRGYSWQGKAAGVVQYVLKKVTDGQ